MIQWRASSRPYLWAAGGEIPPADPAILNPGMKGYLAKLFPKIVKSMPGCKIIEFNIMKDHIHMIMMIPPKYAVSDVIKKIKGIMSLNLLKKVWLVKESLLERRSCMVSRILCFNNRNR